MKTNTMIENGKVFYVAKNGKKVALDLDIDSMIKEAVQAAVKETAAVKAPAVHAPVSAPATVVKVEAKKTIREQYGIPESYDVLPDYLEKHVGKPGVLKGDDGKFYTVCSCCGMIVSPRQSIFSLERAGKVVCIYCQRHYKETGKVYKTPEHDKTVSADKFKTCEATDCKHMVSPSMMHTSLTLTKGKYRLCPACLMKYAATKSNAEPIDEVDPLAASQEVQQEIDNELNELPMFNPDAQ